MKFSHIISSIKHSSTETDLSSPFILEHQRPTSFVCTGVNFDDTKEINLKQILIFLDRDIFQYLKHFPSINCCYALSLTQFNSFPRIQLEVIVNNQSNEQLIRPQLEQILWSYNQQGFVGENGYLRPLPPRFLFEINMTSR